jgi:hypothetical protein
MRHVGASLRSHANVGDASPQVHNTCAAPTMATEESAAGSLRHPASHTERCNRDVNDPSRFIRTGMVVTDIVVQNLCSIVATNSTSKDGLAWEANLAGGFARMLPVDFWR